MGLIGDFASRRKIITHVASTVATLFGLASGLCSLTQHLPLMILYMTVIGFLEGMFWVIVPLMMYELTRGVNADYAFSFITLITAVGYLTGPSSMGKFVRVVLLIRYFFEVGCSRQFYRAKAAWVKLNKFPSLQKAISCRGDGSILIAHVTQSLNKFIASLLSNFTPYEARTQIYDGNPFPL